MKPVNQLLMDPANHSALSTESDKRTETVMSHTQGGRSLTLTDHDMGVFWERMTQMFGHRWVSAYGSSDSDNVWLACLDGLNPKQLRSGMRAVARSGDAWPPTAPQFRKLCESATLTDHGLPDPERAYREVASNAHNPSRASWSHPAVYVAGRETGWFDLRHAEVGGRIEQRFRRNYEIATRRVLAGEQLDVEIPVALEDTRGRRRPLTEKDRTAGRNALAQLRGMV